MRQVQVETFPERDQLCPGLASIVLHTDPVLLLVSEKRQIIPELRADESLVVIRGGINQMADDLFRRPLASGSRPRALLFGNQEQARRRFLNSAAEIFNRFFHQLLTFRARNSPRQNRATRA